MPVKNDPINVVIDIIKIAIMIIIGFIIIRAILSLL